MSVWFRRVAGLNSTTMRKIANQAGVSWSAESIVYHRQRIGYSEGDSADAKAIQDAAEDLLGYRPVEMDEPPEP
jgi:hypothetical protein